MKKLNSPIQITITPIKWVIAIVLIGLIVSNLFQFFGTSGLRSENKKLSKENNDLMQAVNGRNEQRFKDSIEIIERNAIIRQKDSIYKIVEASEAYFKNRAYINYEKLINEQKINYNNADDGAKRGTLSKLANER